ncbi:MAG TPA: glycosyltransferase [Acidimicrobiales bacterium]|nr:glycosyltransferase [Acidimicrobiales bacterium]
MRLLFVTAPATGHLFPLVPIADAALDSGHDVTFATSADFRGDVERVGHDAVAIRPDRATIPPEFIDAETLDELIEHGRRWKPDVIIHDHVTAPAAIAADTLGIPNAYSSVGIMRSPRMISALSEMFRPLWRDRGRSMPDALGLHRYLYLDRCPPSLQRAEARDVAVAHPIRPTSWEPTALTERYERRQSGVPLVYVTLGTFFNSLDVMATILDALSETPVEVLATVGSDRDPADLGPQAAHIRVERFVPQSAIFESCDVVVSHAGSGTIMGTLAAGLPMLLLPQGGDQLDNAARCVERGVARSLTPAATTPDAIRRELAVLLGEIDYCVAAKAVSAEIEAMPGPDRAVELIGQLVGTGAPVTR